MGGGKEGGVETHSYGGAIVKIIFPLKDLEIYIRTVVIFFFRSLRPLASSQKAKLLNLLP